MRSLTEKFKESPILFIGTGLLAIVSAFFLIGDEIDLFDRRRNGLFSFQFHFLFAFISFLGIFVAVVAQNKAATGRFFKFTNLQNNLILLLLGNASAYALNREMQIFDDSADWLSWFLVLLNLAVLQVAFRKKFQPDLLNHLSVGVLAAGLLYGAYGVIYLWYLPFIGLVVFWIFGLSLHLFVPMWWTWALGLLLQKLLSAYPAYLKSALVGISLPLIFIGGFMVKWVNLSEEVAKVHQEAIAPLEQRDLPSWVTVGQHVQRDWMTERILAAESGSQFDFLFPSGLTTSDGERRHDPIVGIASTLFGNSGLDQQQANELRETLFEARHNTEPKLWSGEDLRTKDVVTNVEFFPEYRLSYTEKTLTINHLGGWPETQEALYSFYLPEGAVVTSASLWIGGKEEKALLTTRAKADSAYATIVGVERRDPLLVTWKEGNRVTARIFPCTPDSVRQFKIGITAPLNLVKDRLVYENINFDGPDASNAKETVRLVGDISPISADFSFSEQGSFKEHQGNYSPEWSLELKAPPLAEGQFSFNGKTFELRPLPTAMEAFSYQQAYLDLHSGWSKRDFNHVFDKLKNKAVFACPKGCIRLTEENKDDVFEQMRKLNFSVFPLHRIDKPDDAVVITKYCPSSPTPSDINKSMFFKTFSEFYQLQQKPIRVLNIGGKSSLWFNTLAASRAIQMASMPKDDALQLIENQQFPGNQEDAETIVLEKTGIKIKRVAYAEGGSKAPDHLMRLFVYNDLMKALGKNFYHPRSAEEDYLAAAQEAWVVTPFSSLITLETQADYDRFDIKAPDGKSLKNATISNSGAVPEPHEWLLAIICATMTWMLYQRSRQQHLA